MSWLEVLYHNSYCRYIIVAALALWFYCKYISPLQYFKRLGVAAGPTPYPIIGTTLADVKKDISNHDLQLIQVRKYGKVYGFFIGSRPSYTVADLDMIQQIFIKDFSKFPNRAALLDIPQARSGIVNLRDERWKHVRTILNPTFTASKMKQMLPIMSDSTDILLKKLEKVADTDKSINIAEWLKLLTMEVISASAFGAKCDAQSGSSDKLMESAAAVFHPSFLAVVMCFMIPSLGQYFLYLDRKFMNGFNYINKIVKGIIKTRRQEGATEANYKDLLQLMIDANNNATDGKSLTDDEIVAQSSSFLLAGYETTSSCIAYTTYVLATNPQIQEKLIEEIKDICNDEDNITYEMISKMTYLDMVIHEALRMCPPGFLILREAKVDFQVKGYTFPKGIPIFIPAYAMHRDPEVWPEPDKFDPERFTKEAIEARHPCAFLPFGTGPRNCIGMRFALMEIKLCLAKILRRFKLVSCPETENPLRLAAITTLTPKNGVHLRIQSNTN